MTLGTLAFTQVSDSTPYALLTAALVVRGMGLGASMMPSTAAAYATLDRDSVPRATSAINAVQRIGGSIGVALLSVVLEHQVGGGSGGVGARSQPSAEVAAAFSTTFWWAVVLAALAFVPALLLPRRPAPRHGRRRPVRPSRPRRHASPPQRRWIPSIRAGAARMAAWPSASGLCGRRCGCAAARSATG